MFKREITPLPEGMAEAIGKAINRLEYVDEAAGNKNRPADQDQGDKKPIKSATPDESKLSKAMKEELGEAKQGSAEHLKRLLDMLHKTKPGSSDASQIKHAIEKMHGADKIPAKYKNAKPDMYEETDLEEGSYKDGDTTMGTITVNSDEERKKRAAMYRAKKAEKKVKTEETDLEEKYAKATDKEDDGEGLDPVGKGDSDIDNDGDSDSSDRYLKARRKAIAKAMKKEEVEPLDELSQETIKSYYAKAGSQMQKDRKTVQKHMDRKSAPTASSVKKASDAYKRYQKRVKGLNRAADKMHD